MSLCHQNPLRVPFSSCCQLCTWMDEYGMTWLWSLRKTHSILICLRCMFTDTNDSESNKNYWCFVWRELLRIIICFKRGEEGRWVQLSCANDMGILVHTLQIGGIHKLLWLASWAVTIEFIIIISTHWGCIGLSCDEENLFMFVCLRWPIIL